MGTNKADYQRAYYVANRDKINARKRAWRAKRAYPGHSIAERAWQMHRLRPGDKAAILQAQDGRCYLCGDELALDDAVVEHDHRCCPRKWGSTSYSCADCRRGLACSACNKAVGNAYDDPDRLRRIADNLETAKLAVTQRLAARPLPGMLFE